MGTHLTRMQRSLVVCTLLAMLVAAHAVTEVQELGNDDASSALDSETAMEHSEDFEDDDLGEDEGQGRRGAFLSTTGSFTLSSGGGNVAGRGEEDDDELGEDEGQGRRGAFLSTTGSFTLSSG